MDTKNLTLSIQGTRPRGRPVTRWVDSFNKFFRNALVSDDEATQEDSFWLILAEDREAWQALEDDYILFLQFSSSF